MKRKPLFISERLVFVIILLVFLLAAGGIYFSVQNYVPSEPMQASPANYGREEAYLEITRLIREERDALMQMMEMAEPLDESIKYENAVYLNPELARLMQAHGIDNIYHTPQICRMSTHFSGGIVTSSTYYEILYTQADPRSLVSTWNDDAPWERTDNGWKQDGGNIAYLEEISENFYYFYLAT